MKNKLVYWIDAVLMRSCWRPIWRGYDGEEKPMSWGMRSAAILFAQEHGYRVEYHHFPFFRTDSVKVKETWV